jgi:hypothetical protein
LYFMQVKYLIFYIFFINRSEIHTYNLIQTKY